MKPEEQRIAIAGACGWKMFPAGKDSFGAHCEPHASRGHEAILQTKLPDYPNDLNAMHEAEKILNAGELETYREILSDMMNDDCRIGLAISAPSQIRAPAFLKAKGLWLKTPEPQTAPPLT